MEKKVLITGATGLIGNEIVKVCHQEGWVVHYLTTSKEKLKNSNNYKGFYWNPEQGEIDVTCFDGIDTIINLVGATIAKRWTDSYKKIIIKSRTDTAKLLFDTIKLNEIKSVKQIVSASAIGIYPDSQTNYYSEDFPEKSTSFLGRVVDQWEAAVDEFSNLGVKVTKIRIGLVLSKDGGALPQIVKPINLGLGAAFGDGKQWQSWIHIKDLARIFAYSAKHNVEGLINGVAPNPVSKNELTKMVANTLHKPLILPSIPKFVMKIGLGEMHILLFESQRVSSKKIEDLGFDFEFHHLKPALEDILI